MRRTIASVMAWLAAGVTAVVLATAAVSMVGNQVTGSRPRPLSAEEVRSELSGDVDSTSTTLDSEPPSTEPGPVTSTSLPGGTSTTPTSGPVIGGATSTTTTTAPPAPAVVRTYSLIGGTATLRYEASGVQVIEATPKAGYSVEVEETHDNGVHVEFRSDEHRSEVDGWWDSGPRDEVSEED